MPAVMDPTGTGDNFSDRYADEWDYLNFRKRIIDYATKARKALDETESREESIKLWRDILGNDFKKAASLTKESASYSFDIDQQAPSEQLITQPPFNYRIAIDPKYTCRVTGRCTGFVLGASTRTNGFRQYDLSSNGNRVGRNRSLRFQVVTDVPDPFLIYWKVRNSGQEAFDDSGLRGGIVEDAGRGLKTEPTAYKGLHYVECYVVKDGRVIATDRQTVIITGTN